MPKQNEQTNSECPAHTPLTFQAAALKCVSQREGCDPVLLCNDAAGGELRREEMTYRFKKKSKEDRRALECGKRGEAGECSVYPALRRAKMRRDKDINGCSVRGWEHITLKPWNGREKRPDEWKARHVTRP